MLVVEEMHRQLMAQYDYPFPPPTDAALFMASEGGGEIPDALLRLKPMYMRNTERQPSVTMEIGDTAGMVVTTVLGIRRNMELPDTDTFMAAVDIYLSIAYMLREMRDAIASHQPIAVGWVEMYAKRALEALDGLAGRYGTNVMDCYLASRAKQEERWAK